MRTDPHKSRVDCIISIFFGSAEIKVTRVYQECWHASLPRNGSLGHSMGVFSELGTREFGCYKAWLEAVIRCGSLRKFRMLSTVYIRHLCEQGESSFLFWFNVHKKMGKGTSPPRSSCLGELQESDSIFCYLVTCCLIVWIFNATIS